MGENNKEIPFSHNLGEEITRLNTEKHYFNLCSPVQRFTEMYPFIKCAMLPSTEILSVCDIMDGDLDLILAEPTPVM